MNPYLLYRTEGQGGKQETLAIWCVGRAAEGNAIIHLFYPNPPSPVAHAHEALLEPSSMLPAAPSPAQEELPEPQQQVQPPPQAAKPAGASSIEELLLKAASISRGSTKEQPGGPAATMGGTFIDC